MHAKSTAHFSPAPLSPFVTLVEGDTTCTRIGPFPERRPALLEVGTTGED